tara:strand:+ start:785 stop:1696 length:912 start_codon:yes stop_codon:yes gene_type:complete
VKILLISDKEGWSYAAIANILIKHNKYSDLKISHISCKGNYKKIKSIKNKFDYYFVLGWQNTEKLKFLDYSRTIVGVHSHQSFDNRKTTIDRDVNPPKKIVNYLSRFMAVNTVSKRLNKILHKSGIDSKYTPNGVDTSVFNFSSKKGFIVGSTGSIKNDWNKGINSIIKPACVRSKVKYKFALLEKNRIKYKDMPKFYSPISCFVCASKAEGMPLTVLEAASSGCVVISTRCGDVPLLIQDGVNGFLVDRNAREISNKINYLNKNPDKLRKMSANIRKCIEDKWDWSISSRVWLKFIMDSING